MCQEEISDRLSEILAVEQLINLVVSVWDIKNSRDDEKPFLTLLDYD